MPIQSRDPKGIAKDGRLVFMLRPDREQIIALDAASGREIWSAQAKSRGESWEPGSQVVVVAGGRILVKGSDGRMAAYSTSDGKQLWTRKATCDVETNAGSWVATKCRGPQKPDDNLHILDASSGRETRVVPVEWNDEYVLSAQALMVWSAERHSLRKIPLVSGELGWEVRTNLGFVETMRADSDVVICGGREVQAFDASTGKALWSKRPVGNHRGLSLDPVLQHTSVYLGMPNAVVAFDKRSGEEQRRYPLSGFLRLEPRDHSSTLLVDGTRLALVGNPPQVSDRELIATWTAPGVPPKVMARPFALGDEPLLVDDILVGLAEYDRFVAGYSLSDMRSPLGDVPEAGAISILEGDIAPVDRLSSMAFQEENKRSTSERPSNTSGGPPPVGAAHPATCQPGVRKMQGLQPGTPSGVFGTPHPIVIETAAPDGRWVSACQARRDTDGDGAIDVMFGHHGEAMGDTMEPYLIIGGGNGHPFDELVARAPSGRYVAVREGPCLSLIDTVGGTSTTLRDADLQDPERALGAHRAVSFDAIDGRVLYLRRGTSGDRVVVRELATGRETEIHPGSGWILRAELDPEGESVLIEATGEVRPDRVHTTLAARSCRGDVSSYSVFGAGKRQIVRRIVSAKGGSVREIPGLIRSFGRDVLVRASDRSLWAEAPRGERRPVATSTCDARVAHIDGPRRVILYACESEADRYGKAPLYLYRDAKTIKLRAADDVEGADDWTRTAGRYAIAYDKLIDLDNPDGAAPISAYAGLEKDGAYIRSDGYRLVPKKPAARNSLGRADIGPVHWIPPTVPKADQR